jgi:uncharacterized protein YegP (UPF0339 family)
LAAIYEIYQDTRGKFRFFLVTGSGEILLKSKAYETRRACWNAVSLVRRNASAADHFERRKAQDGKGYFVLRSDDRESLGESRPYRSPDSLSTAIEVVRDLGPSSPINDLSDSRH